MLEQQRFEFGGGDAEGFVLNHFFLAIDDEEPAISVQMPDVARVEPAIAQDARRFFWRFPVALHDLRAAHYHLTIFSRLQFACTRLDIYNFLFGAGNRQTYAFQ